MVKTDVLRPKQTGNSWKQGLVFSKKAARKFSAGIVIYFD